MPHMRHSHEPPPEPVTITYRWGGETRTTEYRSDTHALDVRTAPVGATTIRATLEVVDTWVDPPARVLIAAEDLEPADAASEIFEELRMIIVAAHEGETSHTVERALDLGAK